MLRDLLDDALEASVVGSFSRIGPAVRSRLYGWTPAEPGALVGRTALVTGATSGLGLAQPGRWPISAHASCSWVDARPT